MFLNEKLTYLYYGNDMEKDYESYEYITVKIKYALAGICRESYEAFDWEVLQERISGEGRELRLRRKKRINNRTQVMEQQRKMEDAFVALEHLENQLAFLPVIICIFVGMAGAFLIAMSILSLQRDDFLWFFLLEIPGIALCTIPVWLKKHLMDWRRKKYANEVECQHRLIREACRKGRELL